MVAEGIVGVVLTGECRLGLGVVVVQVLEPTLRGAFWDLLRRRRSTVVVAADSFFGWTCRLFLWVLSWCLALRLEEGSTSPAHVQDLSADKALTELLQGLVSYLLEG